MNSVIAFARKEFKEIIRTPKGIVLPLVFLFFGLMSPITAKILPEVLPKAFKEIAGDIDIVIKTTAVDSWGQFFKNLNQMGILIVILMFMGTVSDERSKGSALLVLTKRLSRTSFILTKFLAATVAVLVSLALGFAACLYYTKVIFGTTFLTEALYGSGLFLAYSLLILALTLFASSLTTSQAVSAGLAVGGMMLISLTPFLGEIGTRWSPGTLSNIQTDLFKGTADWASTWPPLTATLALAAILLVATVLIFRKKEL